jgi:hypothetical protein
MIKIAQNNSPKIVAWRMSSFDSLIVSSCSTVEQHQAASVWNNIKWLVEQHQVDPLWGHIKLLLCGTSSSCSTVEQHQVAPLWNNIKSLHCGATSSHSTVGPHYIGVFQLDTRLGLGSGVCLSLCNRCLLHYRTPWFSAIMGLLISRVKSRFLGYSQITYVYI